MQQFLRANMVVLLFAVSFHSFAGDTLVGPSTVWKYLDDGSNQGTTWCQAAFVDTSWNVGVGQFGYGEGDEMTILNFGIDTNQKFITTYFRTTFNVVNHQVYEGMRLYLKRDDGAVIYLNGHEIYRSNLPPDTIAFDTEAEYSVEPGTEEFFIPVRLDPGYLQTGNNIFAVELHQSSMTSDDVSFDMMLIADSTAEIFRGPYLQMARTHAMRICYRTSTPDITKVYYGTTPAYTDSVIDTNMVIDHAIDITSLQPNTKYYYSIHSSHKLLAGDTTCYFYTAPDASSREPVRIWATGDMGTGNRKQLATRDAYNIYAWNKKTDLMLWVGDNAYPYGSDENYSANVFSNHYEGIMKNAVVYSAAGNHDLMSANLMNESGVYFDLFHFPENGECGGIPSGKESYYSFNYSNIHFVCLESNIDSFGITNTSNMLTWLQQDLAANTMPWTIVFFHNSPYSKGYHDSDIEDNPIFMRQYVNPILESFNVDLVLSGHSHDYERSYLIKGHYGISTTFDSTMFRSQLSGTPPSTYNKLTQLDSGTVYAVIGHAGELTPVQTDWPHPAMYVSIDSVYGSFIIEVNGDTLTGKMLSDQAVVSDEFAIVKNINTGITPVFDRESGYSIFPQPVSDQLSIRSQSDRLIHSVVIIDRLGKETGLTNKSNQNNLRFDVKALVPGVYFVRIKDSKGIYTLKFIKE